MDNDKIQETKYTKPQLEAMRQMIQIREEFGKDRWMTKGELTLVNQHTIDFLERSGYIEIYKQKGSRVVSGIYFRIKIGD